MISGRIWKSLLVVNYYKCNWYLLNTTDEQYRERCTVRVALCQLWDLNSKPSEYRIVTAQLLLNCLKSCVSRSVWLLVCRLSGICGPMAIFWHFDNTLLVFITLCYCVIVAEIDANTYWRYPFNSLLNPRQLEEFIIMDIDIIRDQRLGAGAGLRSNRVRDKAPIILFKKNYIYI